ncbi:recombinase family protein [Aquabacterium sp. A7-Y]|nr:recombinase family protein [Aquabacterium sp. A7-Y]MCW7540665.1 recombinase family protein [Aquabacterium sp. A7-Y]
MTPKRRCAVYTRKSTDEGLEQDYNSLEAQRDAGLAYIASQRHEGWVAVEDGYDDGGYSGGNLDRPSLKRLLADMEARRVDVVVVYKIDRLTRSLTDFARLVEVFDRRGVSFVSVTQQFNTTTSMGRLTLNVLLSFAQFEREVTGERIRDKIAASKAKGMWMGGVPPLGYDAKDRKLVVNAVEAGTVRHIFERFVQLRSIVELARELNRDGVTTKAWITREGRERAGQPIDKQFLYKLLHNPVYLGQIRHKGMIHAGQHEPIIETELWEAVQAVLAEGAARRAAETRMRAKRDVLLRGLLYGPEGDRMIPTFTTKPGGKRYGYYYSMRDKKYGHGTSKLGAIPAAEIEAVVLRQVFDALRAPEAVQAVWNRVRELDPSVDEPHVVVALSRLADVWGQLFPEEQHRIVQLLIERVQITQAGVEIQWRDLGWRELVGELRPNTIGAELLAKEREDAEVIG